MNKILIVVDMQNDFIDGSLANNNAKNIIPNINKKIKEFRELGKEVMFTADTHYKNYLETQEGINLPIPHCIRHTDGWEISKELNREEKDIVYNKTTFGSKSLVESLDIMKYDEIELCGTVSSICVISNALLFKAFYPETKITVDVNCISGVSEEDYKASIIVMKMCQINIIGEDKND